MSKSMRITRRSFLNGLCASTCGAAIHSMTYGGTSMMAYGMPNLFGALTPGQSVFILVNLAGGCSWNITPIYHGAYRDRNPTISYGPENSLALNVEQGLHPSLTALKTVFDEGGLALINKVGIPSQSRSHDEATLQWFRALPSGGAVEGGWAARLTSQASSVFSGISLNGANELVRGGTNPPRALGSIDNFGEHQFRWSDERSDWLRITRDNVMAQSGVSRTDNLGFVRDNYNSFEQTAALIKQETARALPTIAHQFPNTGFANVCKDAARLLNAPSLGVRFIFLQMGGFDTHSEEKDRQASLLNELNGGLRSLIETAKALGRWNDVIIGTMSEFARTFENGSQGTDHGAEAPLLLMGGSVAGRVVNPAPSPAEIQAAGSFLSGYEVDFRRIYKEVVAQMGFNPDLIFPQTIGFTPLGLFR